MRARAATPRGPRLPRPSAYAPRRGPRPRAERPRSLCDRRPSVRPRAWEDEAMSCPSCGHENPADANFCGQCGEPLPSERTCPECGRSNPAELRFCRGCGVALSEAPAGAANGSGGNGAHANAAAALPPPAPPDPSAAESPSAGDGEAEGAGDGAVEAGRIAGGRYAIGEFLGEGGRKRVYRGHDAVLDRDVAVAIVKTEGLDAEGRTRVRREAQAMARLGDHPHVVTVFDIGEE